MNASKHSIQQKPKPAMMVSARKCLQCYFDVDNVTISVWGSAWTGREIVKVDERVVSSKLSVRFSTTHDVWHQGHQHQVQHYLVIDRADPDRVPNEL